MRSTRFATFAFAFVSGVFLAAAPALANGPRDTTLEAPATREAPAQPDMPTAADPGMHPGMKPGANPAPSSATAGTEYVVEQGDTLTGIAEKELGSADKWQVIARANGIEDPAALRVGQKLQIPRDQPSDEHSKL